MPEPPVYCIDTSALIDLHKLYPSDVFVSLWEKLDELVKQGRLITPHEVFKEITRKDDELLRWLKERKSMVTHLDQEQLDMVKGILQRFPQLVDPNRPLPEADPFIIALAVVEGLKWGKDVLPGTERKYVLISSCKR